MKNYKNVTNNCLIIVEGQDLELDLLEDMFKRLFPGCDIKKFINGVKIDSDNIEVFSSEHNIRFILVKPKHNTLSLILKDIAKQPDIVMPYRIFIDEELIDYQFRYIFYLFDIDHTSKEELLDAFNLFNDECDRGLLLISSPSIEAMSDFSNNSFTISKQNNEKIKKTYKPSVQKQIQRISKCKTKTFIKNNIFTLLRHCLHRNKNIFNTVDLFEPLSSFFSGSADITPYYDTEKHYYPIVISFIYLLVAILLDVILEQNPLEKLDIFLKDMSFDDLEREDIIALSPFLND